ncbi:hypothetical protein K438DRAFT_2114808 [Mycena galopus ATCC 62051]|nr:hypothetical protein K438DRAFT_2114808 [Mycena galopus ATCC 62051]
MYAAPATHIARDAAGDSNLQPPAQRVHKIQEAARLSMIWVSPVRKNIQNSEARRDAIMNEKGHAPVDATCGASTLSASLRQPEGPGRNRRSKRLTGIMMGSDGVNLLPKPAQIEPRDENTTEIGSHHWFNSITGWLMEFGIARLVGGSRCAKLPTWNPYQKLQLVLGLQDELLNNKLIFVGTRKKYAHLNSGANFLDAFSAFSNVTRKQPVFIPAELLGWEMYSGCWDTSAGDTKDYRNRGIQAEYKGNAVQRIGGVARDKPTNSHWHDAPNNTRHTKETSNPSPFHQNSPESPRSGVRAVGFGSHGSTPIGSFGLESDNTATAAAFGTRRSSLELDNTNPILELAFGTRFGYGSVGGGKQHRRPELRFGFAARVSVDDEYVRYRKFVRPVEHWRCLTTRASGYGVARGGKFEAAAGRGQGRGP